MDDPASDVAMSRLAAHAQRRWGANAQSVVEAFAPTLGGWGGARLVARESPRDDALWTPHEVERALDDEERRAHGVFFTPAPLADALIGLLREDTTPRCVADLSAGSGQLLCAALCRWPGARVVAVERAPELALACALSLAELRAAQGWSPGAPVRDVVWCGDGLSVEAPLDGVDLVVANPPYVGEKGNRARFQALRAAHPHLAPWFGPRVDLAYLFLHRALDALAPGGHLAALTSAYWLQATGADRLRADLCARAPLDTLVSCEDLRLFDDAPGHHSVLFTARREDAGAEGERLEGAGREVRVFFLGQPSAGDGGIGVAPGAPGWLDGAPQVTRAHPAPPDASAPWSLLAPPELDAWGAEVAAWSAPLGDMLRDRQGFVSGADRVSRRHLDALNDPAIARGAPIFLAPRDQLPAPLRALDGLVVRPLIRGREVRAGHVWTQALGAEAALFLDETVSPAHEEALAVHLAPFRPVLERRREVQRGSMPWYRLHWPRDLAAQTGPKLVCPRRAAGPQFMLDLSGSAVSSDCTFLTAPAGSPSPARDLLLAMLVLNSAHGADALRLWGKRKGVLYELYAQPLRALPVPLTTRAGALTLADEAAAQPWGQALLDAREAAWRRLIRGEIPRSGYLVVQSAG